LACLLWGLWPGARGGNLVHPSPDALKRCRGGVRLLPEHLKLLLG